MEKKENLVGKKINLALLTKELDKNKHNMKVCDFLDTFYFVMTELEAEHPLVKEIMKRLGKDYDQFICAVIFSLCMRLSQATMSEEVFLKMIERITSEEVEIELPQIDKGGMN